MVSHSKTPQDHDTTDEVELKETQSGQVEGDTPELRKRCSVAIAPFGFFDAQKAEMVDAYLEAPDGVDVVIRDALDSAAKGKLNRPPAACIIAAIRKGEHLRHQYVTELAHQPYRTGWRLVYGESHAACTYVEDPEGTDVLPPGYDLSVKNPHIPGAWRNA